MTSRGRLIATLSGETPDCVPVAPLADSFAAAQAGVQYASLTWKDQVRVARETGLDLLCNTAATIPDAVARAWKRTEAGTKDGFPVFKESFKTPVGTLTQTIQQLPYNLPWTLEYPIKSEEDFRPFNYVLEWIADVAEAPDAIAEAAHYILEDGLVHTWVAIPLELLGWIERSQAMIFALEEPARMREMCETIHRGQIGMMANALEKGSDIIAFGIVGTEITSPDMFQEFAKPYARDFADLARTCGRWSLLHMCGHVKLLLDDIREIGPTVLETLAPPPEGDTEDIAAARDTLGRDIVAKGNMPLTFLANASPAEVRAEGRRIIEKAGPDRFILGCADVLLDYHPRENVEALVRAGHEWRLTDTGS
ncbi:uroporphyrinogen decarboxylase family protein [Verrucomicrobiota bacterium]